MAQKSLFVHIPSSSLKRDFLFDYHNAKSGVLLLFSSTVYSRLMMQHRSEVPLASPKGSSEGTQSWPAGADRRSAFLRLHPPQKIFFEWK